MLKIKKIVLFLCVISTLIFAHQGICQDVNNEDTLEEEVSVGKIISVENSVKIIRDETEEIVAKAELPLFAGDQIVTEEKSSAKFSLNDGSQFMVGESSEMAIDEYAELAKESEEDSSVLRVVVGFLRSTIKEFKGESIQPTIYTPTAVAGVRGTVFDTVVSLDGATAIVVDEGRVEIECDTAKTLLDKGKMAELDDETKDLKPVSAIPLKERNWNVWREKRETIMVTRFPQMISRQRQHFEAWSDQYAAYTADVRKSEIAVAQASEQLRKAKESGDEVAIQNATIQLKEKSHTLNGFIKKSCHHLNKSKAVENQMARIEKYVRKHPSRFNPKDLALINSEVTLVRQKGKRLKTDSRDLIKELKKTVKKAKKVKKFKKEKAKKIKTKNLEKKAKTKESKNKADVKKLKKQATSKKKHSGKKHGKEKD